jgi:fructose-1,6-bisphosphatase/inositol monophosphatase family enzyme
VTSGAAARHPCWVYAAAAVAVASYVPLDGSGIVRRRKPVFGVTHTGHCAVVRRRTLTSYLLMPRPKDLVKGLLIPTTFVVAALSTGEVTALGWLRAGATLAAVELLIYPARYQWNDARGFVADQQHPDCAGRGRLPGPMNQARRNVSASCATALLRLLCVLLLVLMFPSLHLGGILSFAAAGVFGVAFAYEGLRSRFTGRDARIPPPLRFGVLLIWLTVGAGYAVRGMIGLALAVDASAHVTMTAWAVVTLWAYGVAFVTSRWAVEATAFAFADHGRVRFKARSEQAREHLLVLVRWLPERLVDSELTVRRWAPLSQRTSTTAPWNVAMVVAGLSASVTGRLLCATATISEQIVTAAAGGAATLVVVLLVSRARVSSMLVGVAVLLGCCYVTGCPRPVVGTLPWVLIAAAYLFFTSRSLHVLDQPGVFARLGGWIRAFAGKAVLGTATWNALQKNSIHEVNPADDSADLVDVARRAAAAGAEVAMHWWADHTQLEVQEKRGPRDLVSRSDRETEDAIRAELVRLRPDDAVLGEENGAVDGSSGIRWVIDPIDGTTSYLYGRSDWAVSVAAVRCSDEVIVAAAVVEPVIGKTTSAQRGQGTYCNGQRVTVNDVGSLDHALIEINLGRDDQREIAGAMVHQLSRRVRDLRRGGSAASALAHVATGRADGVWAPGLQPWDCAGGILLVEEAGGDVGDLAGPSGGSWPASGDVLAANPMLWAALRSILSPVYEISA